MLNPGIGGTMDKEVKLIRQPESKTQRSKKPFKFVIKKNGSHANYEKGKIAEAVYQAAGISTGGDKKTARKIADEVENYLVRHAGEKDQSFFSFQNEILKIEDINTAVEEVLKEMRLDAVVYAYRSHRIAKEKMSKKVKVTKETRKKGNTTDLALMVEADTTAEMFKWDRAKIAQALVKEAELDIKVAGKIASNVEKKIIASGMKKLTTSLIRELVDSELFVMGYSAKLKKQVSLGMPTYDLEQMIFSKSRENSNVTANNPEAINLTIAETTLKQYALNNIFSSEVSGAHMKGMLHLHDLGYPVRVYCSSHSLEYIKKYGLQMGNLDIISSPAKHARTLTGHLNTFLATMQPYYAGALGIAYLNIFYAPYMVGMSYKEIKQEAQYLIFSLSQSAFSRGGQVLFIDANIHTGIPNYMKDIPAIGPKGEYTGKPYSAYKKEAALFARALMEVWRDGDSFGHIFAFPKMDFHINDDTFNDPEQLELLKFACEIASGNGVPYFVFDRDEITLSACCRLRTQIEDDYMIKHPESMRFCGFQNVTLNLPQAAYRAGRGNVDGLLKEIKDTMDIAVKAHLQKKEFISKLMEKKGAPLWEIGKLSKDGRKYVDLEKATYIIGLIGLNECVQYLTGKQLHEDEEVYKLGIKIISFMSLQVKEYSRKYNLKFAMEESPAESAARRMAKVDLREYPESREILKGNMDEDEFYYTNSIHLAANAPVSFVERVQKQSRFHSLIESGAIIHAFIGEHKPSPESIMNLVEKTFRNTQTAQLTVSPEFTVCNDCNKMSRGLRDSCEYCDSESVYGITRIVGYFSRIDNWNKSKRGELKDRHDGEYGIG